MHRIFSLSNFPPKLFPNELLDLTETLIRRGISLHENIITDKIAIILHFESVVKIFENRKFISCHLYYEQKRLINRNNLETDSQLCPTVKLDQTYFKICTSDFTLLLTTTIISYSLEIILLRPNSEANMVVIRYYCW